MFTCRNGKKGGLSNQAFDEVNIQSSDKLWTSQNVQFLYSPLEIILMLNIAVVHNNLFFVSPNRSRA